MYPEYRIIDWDMTVPQSNIETVNTILDEAGWKDNNHTRVEKGIYISPTPKDYTAKTREGMQVLWDIAPHVLPGSKLILEIRREPKPWEPVWLHLLYDGSTVGEQETPAHQWDTTEVGGEGYGRSPG